LAERKLQLGRPRRPYLAPAIAAVAMIVAANRRDLRRHRLLRRGGAGGLAGRVAIGEAYDAMESPILLLGALIPVSEALTATGGSQLIAGWLAGFAHALPPMGALALMLIAAMAVSSSSTTPRPC
jgi:di/tricarboxylate transporter